MFAKTFIMTSQETIDFKLDKGWEPLSNKIWTLQYIFAFSTVAIAVWSKTVFDEELKPSSLGAWFSEI